MSPFHKCIYDPQSKYSAVIREEFWIMSHFECRLNRRLWRSKKLYKLSKLGGGVGAVIWTKSKRSATFFKIPSLTVKAHLYGLIISLKWLFLCLAAKYFHVLSCYDSILLFYIKNAKNQSHLGQIDLIYIHLCSCSPEFFLSMLAISRSEKE